MIYKFVAYFHPNLLAVAYFFYNTVNEINNPARQIVIIFFMIGHGKHPK